MFSVRILALLSKEAGLYLIFKSYHLAVCSLELRNVVLIGSTIVNPINMYWQSRASPALQLNFTVPLPTDIFVCVSYQRVASKDL